jgi:hypothetical protein
MFGILNSTLRIATRSDRWPDGEKRPVRRASQPTRDWFHDTPHNPRTGLRPGESWSDRN